MRYSFIGMLILCIHIFQVNEKIIASDIEHHFSQSDKNSQLTIDYSDLRSIYMSAVLDLGMSTRNYAPKLHRKIGTLLEGKRNRKTFFEGNRLPYESIRRDENIEKINKIRLSLEKIPSHVPLYKLTKNEQIAYWLNLYNITVIEFIAKMSLTSLKSELYGDDGLMSRKLLKVDGYALSLNDIQFNIVYKGLANNNPLMMYGFYQGVIGGPNIRREPYEGKKLISQLNENAKEFINSNRGTQFDDNKIKISWFYGLNSILFPDFEGDIKKHLSQYLIGKYALNLNDTRTIEFSIRSFNRADYQGGERQFGLSVNSRTNPGQKSRVEGAHMLLLQELIRRYKNKRSSVSTEEVVDREQ